MKRKVIMEGIPENISDLEEPCPTCIFTKTTKITRGPTTDVYKFSPGFMLQMHFAFFNVKRIRGFYSNFVAICSATSYPFGFSSRSKHPGLYILKYIVTTLSKQYKKGFIHTNTIPNSPAGNQLTSQDKRNMWIIAINGEEPITAQGALDYINLHQTPLGKSKVKIILCRGNINQRTDIGDIRSRFYQVKPVISHLKFSLPKKPPTPKRIGEILKCPQKQ